MSKPDRYGHRGGMSAESLADCQRAFDRLHAMSGAELFALVEESMKDPEYAAMAEMFREMSEVAHGRPVAPSRMVFDGFGGEDD